MFRRKLEVEFSLHDCKNVIYWYEIAFKRKHKPTQSDTNTFTKIKAFAISEQEDNERWQRYVADKPKNDD